MKIVYIGTVDFSYHCPEVVLSHRGDVAGVITMKKSSYNSYYKEFIPSLQTLRNYGSLLQKHKRFSDRSLDKSDPTGCRLLLRDISFEEVRNNEYLRFGNPTPTSASEHRNNKGALPIPWCRRMHGICGSIHIDQRVLLKIV